MSTSPEGLGYVPAPTADALFRFLGWPPPEVEQALAAQAHLNRAVALVGAYTRGRGFIGLHLAGPLAEVVLSTAGRTMNNPTSDSRVQAGQYTASPGQPDWTLQERLILDGYRRRVA